MVETAGLTTAVLLAVYDNNSGFEAGAHMVEYVGISSCYTILLN